MALLDKGDNLSALHPNPLAVSDVAPVRICRWHVPRPRLPARI